MAVKCRFHRQRELPTYCQPIKCGPMHSSRAFQIRTPPRRGEDIGQVNLPESPLIASPEILPIIGSPPSMAFATAPADISEIEPVKRRGAPRAAKSGLKATDTPIVPFELNFLAKMTGDWN
jgi:hypothetical protein